MVRFEFLSHLNSGVSIECIFCGPPLVLWCGRGGSGSPRVRVTRQVLTTLVLAGQSGRLIQIVYSYFIIITSIDTAMAQACKQWLQQACSCHTVFIL